jgi:nickel transport protein
MGQLPEWRERLLILLVSAGVLVCVLVCVETPAWAHKVHLFALVRGGRIEGEVYFEGGAPVRRAKIQVVDPDGQELGTAEADDQGKFAFPVTRPVDHTLIAQAGFGHRARYTVAVADLPPSVSAGESAQVGHAWAVELQELERQVAGLRRDIHHAQNRLWLRDVLGGVGYILGVSGLLFYVWGRRRQGARPTGK